MYKKVFSKLAMITLMTVVMFAALFTGCGLRVGDNIKIDERNTSEFNSVSVEASLSNIELIEADNFGLEIFAPKRFSPEWDITNGHLTIREKTTDFIFNLSISSPRYYVKVYYPTGTVFNEVILRTSSGDINVTRVDANDLDVFTSSGEINASAENFSNASMKTSSGNIRFSGNGEYVDMNTSSGSIKSDIEGGDAIRATTSSGSISITGRGDAATALIANTQSGNITANGVAWRDINTVASSGDITINGALLGNSYIKTSSGSLNITVDGDASQFGYSLTASSGSIYWDGMKLAKPANSSGSFENNIDATTSSGDIRVDFR